MGEREYSRKKDYSNIFKNDGVLLKLIFLFTQDLLYTEASKLLNKFSHLQSKKIPNPFFDPFFLIDDSTAAVKSRLDISCRKHKSKKTLSLRLILWDILKTSIILSGVLKIISVITQYLLFYYLDCFTDTLKEYAAQPADTTDIKKRSILYLCLMILCILINSFSENRFTRYFERSDNQMTTALQILLYEKLMKAKIFEKRDENEEMVDEDAQKSSEDEQERLDLNNLITADVEAAKGLVWGFHEFWTAIVSIIICFYMIGSKLKSALYFGIGIMILLNIINIIVAKKMLTCVEKMSGFKDKRIALTTDVIQGIKSLKYLSWETTFLNRIHALRRQEFKNLTIYKILDAILGIFWNFVPTLMLFSTLSWYSQGGYSISDANVFTIVGLMNLLLWPMGIIPWAVGKISEAKIALDRISRYLSKEEIDNTKVFRGDEASSTAIEIKRMKFSWPKETDEDSGADQKEKPSSKKIAQETNQITENLLSNDSLKSGLDNDFQLVVEDLTVVRGEIYLLLGKVGCGKTALLKSIMNELDSELMAEDHNTSLLNLSLEGSRNNESNFLSTEKIKMTFVNSSRKIIINGRVAYVSQNNWLQDTSIRENILMGLDFNEKWYQTCLDVCELLPDLEVFPRGDNYRTNGSNLSGGQRQRVALCRALYHNADIYLFDDAFSSLDIHVSERIYKKLLVDLLKPMGKTVIFATSTHNFVDLNSKLIIITDSHRVIINQEEARKEMKRIFQENSQAAELLEVESSKKAENHSEIPQLSRRKASRNEEHSSKEEDEEALKNVKIKENTHDENEEEREEGAISNETIYAYIKATGKLLCIILVFTNIALQAVKSVSDFWLKSRITPGDTSFSGLDAITTDFTIMYAYLISAILVIMVINNAAYAACCITSAREMFKRLMNSIMFSKMAFFDRNEVGRIVNRVSKDTYTIDESLTFFIGVFLDKLPMVIAYPVIVMVQFPWMIICFALATLVMFYFQKKYREINREIKRLTSINNSKVINHVTETILGVVSVRAFKKENRFLETFLRHLDQATKSFYMGQLVFYWADIRLALSSVFLFLLLSVAIIIFILLDFSLNYADCAMALTFLFLFNQQLNQILVVFVEMEQNFISVERERHYFDNPLEDISFVPQRLVPLEVPDDEKGYSIVFDKVFLSYIEGKGKEDVASFALKEVSFAIKKGEKVAFCGRTGSGKTSILNALFKLYDIQSGDIRLEGQESIRNLSLNELRSRIAIIPQFGFLFRGTLRENLDPQGKCQDAALKNIVRESGFCVKGTSEKGRISEQEAEETNLDFTVENSGANLSNGEKQIINFLRILIRNNDIICLDEATSNMDPRTDMQLHEALFKFAENKTLLVITHRLEHIHRYDRVFVMEKGQIVEQGHVNDLRTKKDSFFRTLIERANH